MPIQFGTRTTVSDANGGYIFKALPSGLCKIRFEIPGVSPVEKTETIAVGSWRSFPKWDSVRLMAPSLQPC